MEALSARLLTAVGTDDLATVRNLVDRGADIDVTDGDGDGVLRYAIGRARVELVEFLLDRGASVTAPSSNWAGEKGGYSILHAAAEAGWVDGTRLLLRSGANPNERADDGSTPLMGAAAAGKVMIAEILINAGAEPNMIDHEGDTAVYYAVSNGLLNEVIALHRMGVTIDPSPNRFGHTPLSAAASMSTFGSPAPPETHGVYLDIARYLVRHGANPAPMYENGYIFTRYNNGRRRVFALQDVSRVARMYDDLDVVVADLRSPIVKQLGIEPRPTR